MVTQIIMAPYGRDGNGGTMIIAGETEDGTT